MRETDPVGKTWPIARQLAQIRRSQTSVIGNCATPSTAEFEHACRALDVASAYRCIQLLDVGASFVREDATASSYRIFSIDDRHPAVLRTEPGEGASVALEIWKYGGWRAYTERRKRGTTSGPSK